MTNEFTGEGVSGERTAAAKAQERQELAVAGDQRGRLLPGLARPQVCMEGLKVRGAASVNKAVTQQVKRETEK